MNIAICNHMHPDARHVSALRMREFARFLAARGNRVVLITGTLHPDDPGADAAAVEEAMATHDWSAPLHIAVRPAATPLRRAAREGRVMSPFRQMIIGCAYLFGSGIFADWRVGVSKMSAMLSQAFSPDVVYGTFGNTDAWLAARDLAARAGCPWVADYKDPWSSFVPAGLREIVARRFTDMAAMTTFSKSHSRDADKWFACEKHVMYSGYPEGADIPAALPMGNEDLHLCLSGSVYQAACVKTLIEGINRVASARRVKLSYAGNDGTVVQRLAADLRDDAVLENHDYLETRALLALQRSASVNIYIRNAASLFQQKPIELLAVGRPVMAVPGEGAEAAEIASNVRGTLVRAGTPDEVARALSAIETRSGPVADTNRMQAYSWAAQTDKLRDLLAGIAGPAR